MSGVCGPFYLGKRQPIDQQGWVSADQKLPSPWQIAIKRRGSWYRFYSELRTMNPTMAPMSRLTGTAMASAIAMASVWVGADAGFADQSSGSGGIADSESECLSGESLSLIHI